MTQSLVIDASLILKTVLPNEHQNKCQQLMTAWQKANYQFFAPTLWLYEIISAITKAIHFDMLTVEEGQHALTLVQKLNIQLILPDDNLTQSAFEWTLRLKRAVAYDSFYLALAESLQVEFWTADKRLYNSVNNDWVHYIE
ncbi:MAG: hypothetical protein B6242_10800 [Anaerolineaceae bacterium 4572_78]|nr:MAG: hypothetical protein B6242_10800 [Anaerolineaceae bacterium 4572_78]